MIIVYRYPIHKIVLPIFRDLINMGNREAELNIIDTETIRKRIAEPKTEIDEKVKYHIDYGLLISDVYFVDLLFQDWTTNKRNVIVDFPRNVQQINSLRFHLEQQNDVIDKVINYQINDYNKVYDIAQSKYGKFYDSGIKEQTIEHMKAYEKRTEKLGELPIIQLDIMDDNIDYLK